MQILCTLRIALLFDLKRHGSPVGSFFWDVAPVWLLVSLATAKSRHVVGRESSTFFLSLASEVQERYLSLRFRSQTKKK